MKAVLNNSTSMATFYGLPKIHKSRTLLEKAKNSNSVVINCPCPEDLTFRPIVSCRQCPTTKLCEGLNNLLQPFLSKIKYRLRDTWDFLKRCRTNVTHDTFLITGDISSLYTNITTEKGCEAISYFYDKYGGDLIPPRFTKDFILSLFTFCQEHLYFVFKDVTYVQISGTGMGRIYAPAAADIKMGYQEILLDEYISKSLGREAAHHFSTSYFRYLDDVFMDWNPCIPGLNEIKGMMNTIDPNIQFTFESTREREVEHLNLPFLDVKAWVKEARILTDIYSKPTDTFNYLPFCSSHPRHCARNIPYSLARRIRGIVSDENLAKIRVNEMKNRLISKGYPINIIEQGIKKAWELSREEIIEGNNCPETNNTNPVYFVTTHNTLVKQSNNHVQAAVTLLNATRSDATPIFVHASRRKSPSLKDQLMYRPLSFPKVRKCGKNCTLCNFIHEGDHIQLKTGLVVRTNGNFECSSRNVIYIAICKGCLEIYIGETGDMLQIRWTIHRQHSKLTPKDCPCHADIHFRLCGKNRYIVFPFYRPRKNDVFLRRRYEQKFIKMFKPLLNGQLY